MNIRISNLSSSRDIRLKATESLRFLDGTNVFTSSDTTVPLIPRGGRFIEGTLQLQEGDIKLTLMTDCRLQNAIISTSCGRHRLIPLEKNIAIEWDERVVEISAY